MQCLCTIAADVMNDALVALDKAFAAERIVCRTVLQLHGAYIVTVISISTRIELDEFVFEAHLDSYSRALTCIRATMASALQRAGVNECSRAMRYDMRVGGVCRCE